MFEKKGVKKRGFEKKNSKIGKGFKNLILNMRYLPPKKIFKKSQYLGFFLKKGGKEALK